MHIRPGCLLLAGLQGIPFVFDFALQLLGALGMIDSNESDWKVIVINAADPLAATYNDISDVPQVRLKGLVSTLGWWAVWQLGRRGPLVVVSSAGVEHNCFQRSRSLAITYMQIAQPGNTVSSRQRTSQEDVASCVCSATH